MANRLCTQTIEFTLHRSDGFVLRRSWERFSVSWFDDVELKQIALDAQMKVIETAVDLNPGSDPRRVQKLYVLGHRS
jgi:hypothetical protein